MTSPSAIAQNRSEAAGKALVGIVERAVRRMITGGFRFAIVVTNGGATRLRSRPPSPANIAIKSEVFTGACDGLVADGVANVVKKRGGFEKHTRFGGKDDGPAEADRKAGGQVREYVPRDGGRCRGAARKRASQRELARVRIVAMRFFTRENLRAISRKRSLDRAVERSEFRRSENRSAIADPRADGSGDRDVDFHARY